MTSTKKEARNTDIVHNTSTSCFSPTVSVFLLSKDRIDPCCRGLEQTLSRRHLSHQYCAKEELEKRVPFETTQNDVRHWWSQGENKRQSTEPWKILNRWADDFRPVGGRERWIATEFHEILFPHKHASLSVWEAVPPEKAGIAPEGLLHRNHSGCGYAHEAERNDWRWRVCTWVITIRQQVELPMHEK